jgi:hypothetical protein
VAERGATGGIDEEMEGKAKNSIVLFGRLLAAQNVQLRLSSTASYNSIYRGVDQILVDTRTSRIEANNADGSRLCKILGGEMASMHLDSFERRPTDKVFLMGCELAHH